MKNIVLEKIANLKESLIRRDEMKEVESQVQDIFKMIDSIESKEEKHQAMDAMMDIAIFLMGEIGKFQISDFIKALESKSKKVQKIKVQVNRYIDVDLVEIDKRVSYSGLCTVLNKVREDFESSIDDMTSISYNKSKEVIEFDYPNKRGLVVSVTPWNLSDESINIYIEGFVEYIQK